MIRIANSFSVSSTGQNPLLLNCDMRCNGTFCHKSKTSENDEDEEEEMKMRRDMDEMV